MAMSIINKYVWLVETIYRAHKISFEDINRKWLDNEDFSEGVELPLRTFHKWRIAVEEIFGLIIENEKRGEYRYYIENEDAITRGGIRSWMFNTISTSNILWENRSLSDRILLEDIPSGREYLQPIIDAMKKNQLIHFTYYNYWRGDYRQHCIEPYCVKLFRQRWYVVGKELDATDNKPRAEMSLLNLCRGATDEEQSSNVIHVYSLDRMSKFSKSEQTFKYPTDFDGENFFKGCYGIIAGDGTNLEHVALKVSAGQANYMRDLPMHQSQREIEQNDKYSIFELNIRPTFDFQQEILWNGEDIEVLEPMWLRKEIAGKIKLMWNKYQERRNK
ncbi:MAG: WYL domain-containing protein [Prevotella sp.]|nr:WYL domain-containing protein [Candidatus Equicola stercoris]